jgi:hypothetical protein
VASCCYTQKVLALADAIGRRTLCAEVENRVHVTEATTTSWLEWLSKEHGSCFSRIREQIKQVLKRQLQDVKL